MNRSTRISPIYRHINKKVLLFVCVASVFTCQTFAENKELLTLEKRVDLQKAIESVYWKHRIWPKENKSPKPSLDERISSSVLNNKVLSNLRKSAALESFFQTSITPEQVQAEINRMVQESKDPGMLSEIFSALRNDPYLIANGLAHPLLVEAQIRKLYAYDQRFHGTLRQRAEADLKQFGTPERLPLTSGKYLETMWIKNDDPTDVDPEKFYLTSEEWGEYRKKLQQIFASPAANHEAVLPQQIVSSLQEDENSFFVITILEDNEDRIILATVRWYKTSFDEWWNQIEPNIQVPAEEEPYEYDAELPAFRNVSCSNDSWTPTAEPPAPNAPSGRFNHVAVWTGAEMIVWGGFVGGMTLDTGGRYYPAMNNWLPTSNLNVPIRRHSPVAVWTGTEMIVWGGVGIDVLRSGGRYDPITDSWIPTTLTNAPEERWGHTAIWTGIEMIVWGGRRPTSTDIYNSGGRYDPSSDAWITTSLDDAPTIRYSHTSVWTGSKMIIWGGFEDSLGNVSLNTGGIYDPEFDIWESTTLTNAPGIRAEHSAVWIGNEMIIWGGLSNGIFFDTGAKYDPSSDSWFHISTINVPIARAYSPGIWTGEEMIVWGGLKSGSVSVNSGGRYNPATDQWAATSLINAPERRHLHTAVWAANTMIVWGGFSNKASGGIYNPNPNSNSMPISVDDNYDAVEDTTLTIAQPGVLTNDSDPDLDPFTAILTSGPLNGSVTLNPDGSFEYTALANFNGTDSFTYQAYDGSCYSSPSTVTLNIDPVNDAPVANNEFYSGEEDSQIVITAPGILGNDTDVENDALTAALISGPSHGQLDLNSDGSFNYVPQENFHGSDAFTYNATDSLLPSNPATVSITINPVNDVPAGVNDSYTVQEDIVLNIAAPGLLNNDTDVDGNPLTANLVSGPTHGNLLLNADGSFAFTPFANFNGTDSFTYKANDGTADSNLVTVNITVESVNDLPVAQNDSYSLQEDGNLGVAAPGVLSNDSDIDNDPLQALLVNGPTHGNLSLNADGSFTFTPFANFNGTDSFTYKANDGTTDSNLVTANITVQSVNDLPVAQNDSYSLQEDEILNVAAPGLLSNDSDIDNDPLQALLVNGPTHGNLSLNADGSFSFTPFANFNGNDSFTYKANDGTTDSNLVTARITVEPVNDLPVAQNDSYSLQEDGNMGVAPPGVLSNDTDIDNDPLQATLVTAPTNGTFSFNTDGSFTYAPNLNFNGTDSFTYKAFDGNVFSNVASVSITIVEVNDNPIVIADVASVDQNSSNNLIDVLANDTDPEGEPLTILSITQGTNGTASIVGDDVGYTPHPDFNGNDNFSYTVSDGNGGVQTGFVTVMVLPPDCLFCDEFENSVLDPNWSYIKPSWTESGGTLIGNPTSRKATVTAIPAFQGCQICTVEASMQSVGGPLNKVWLLSWYLDKNNTIELLMNEESDRWILKQRVNGNVVAKAKNSKAINPDTAYQVRITFDGTIFKVYVDDLVVPLITLTPQAEVSAGFVGFQVKNTIGSFDYIRVND